MEIGEQISSQIDQPTLKPYQVKGANWLSKKTHALLADEMGLGKSAQSIKASLWANCFRVLVLCPAIARFNWRDEFERFDDSKRDVSIILSKSQMVNTPVVICSYDMASIDLVDKLPQFDLLILDEAHYLKNPEAKRTQNVFGKYGLIRKAKRCWALTGTPAPNHIGEMWPILYTFGATPLKYDQFIQKFCVVIETGFGKQIIGTKTQFKKEIQEMLAKIMLRRQALEVLKELPPIYFQDLVTEPSEVELGLHSTFAHYVMPKDRSKEFAEEMKRQEVIMKAIEDGSVEPLRDRNIPDLITGLSAISKSVNSLRRYVGLQKVPNICELINEELLAGVYHKIVIFAIHKDVIEATRQKLEHFEAMTIYGGTPPLKRQRHIERFKSNPKAKVLICNIQAAGTAISLANCHHVIFMEQDWVPANNAQAAKRCHRIGQTRPVIVRTALLRDSFDQRIGYILRRKTQELIEIFDRDQKHIFNDLIE